MLTFQEKIEKTKAIQYAIEELWGEQSAAFLSIHNVDDCGQGSKTIGSHDDVDYDYYRNNVDYHITLFGDSINCPECESPVLIHTKCNCQQGITNG